MRGEGTRAARGYDLALLTGALAVIVVGYLGWRDGVPHVGPYTAVVLLSSALLLGTLLVGDDPLGARAVGPVVMGVALAAIVSPLVSLAADAVMPLWATAVVVTYVVALRGSVASMLPHAAAVVLAGECAVIVAPLLEADVPWGPVVGGLVGYFVVVVLLTALRRRLRGRPGLPPGSGRRLRRAGLAGGGYAVGLFGALNVLGNDPGDLWVAAGVAASGLLAALVIWQTDRISTLRRLSEALASAARSTPWPEEEIERRMVDLISTYVRVEAVTVASSPGGPGTVTEQVLPDRWVVARRRYDDSDFGPHDTELVAVVATLGRESYVRAATERRLHTASITDDLTGLWEYKYWRTILADKSRERSPGEIIGVVFFDLDHFKQTNETYGHMRADIALAAIGRRLTEVSGRWRFARFGGDEFVGMYHGIRDEEELDEQCDALKRLLGEPVSADGRDIVLGVTVGRTLSTEPDEAAGRIVARAERDVRRRKSLRPGSEAEPSDAELVRGLLDGGLSVVFQPLVALPSRTVQGWEALLRARLPGQGIVPPPDMIAAARRVGALDTVTWRVAEQAIDVVDEVCRRLGRPFVVSINIESDQLGWDSPAVDRITHRARTATAEIVLEVTERGDDEWGEERFEVVDDLERRGLGVALDDYGAGQSRLRAVARRRWHWVKLDRDFLTTDEPGLKLLRYNVQAMHELGQQVVLEGLEEEHQVQLAESLGIDIGQGHWFSRPRSAEELLAGADGGAMLDGGARPAGGTGRPG